MDNPEISVVMPVYNSEVYLREAMESILNQTIENFEFIILNDGSTDRSESVIREYADTDKRIKAFNSKQNKGLIYQLNKGMELSKGKYIARMDSDDISFPGRLEKQFLFMEENPSVGVCGTWLEIFQNERRDIHVQPTGHEEIFAGLLFKTRIWHATVMMRRDALPDLAELYRLEFIHVEDYELWVRLGLSGVRFANIPEVLFEYRLHEKSVCGSFSLPQMRNAGKVRRIILNRLEIEPGKDELELHNLMASGSAADREGVERASVWLEKVRKSNEAKGLFSGACLYEELCRAWLNLAKNSLSCFPFIFEVFLAQGPGGGIDVSLRQKLEFVLKLLLQKPWNRKVISIIARKYYRS